MISEGSCDNEDCMMSKDSIPNVYICLGMQISTYN